MESEQSMVVPSLAAQTTPAHAFPPIVIPQTSKTLRGVFFSPFSRAYPHILSSTTPPMTKAEFIRFVDDLNEAFIASPIFQAIGLAGTVTSFAPSGIAQIVGSAVSWTASLGSTATSMARTRAFVKDANQRIFAVRGLVLRILSTRDMLSAVGVDSGAFQLPPLPEFNGEWAGSQDGSIEDPRIRWLKALEGHVAPLDWNVPKVSEQQNWFKQAGARQAKRQDEKQIKKLRRRREKQGDEQRKELAKVQEEVAKSEAKAANVRAEIDRLESAPGPPKLKKVRSLEKELRKIQEKITEETEKNEENATDELDKVDKKERKIVQKIRWLVIVPSSTTSASEQEVDTGIED